MVERVCSYLENEFAPNGARGVATFASEDPELFEVIWLDYAVQGRVVLADRLTGAVNARTLRSWLDRQLATSQPS